MDIHDVRPIADDECRKLLSLSSVGRIALAEGDGVEIVPVAYLADGATVTVRPLDGTLTSSDRWQGASITFQIDHVGEHDGWSVTGHGRPEAGASADPRLAAALGGVDGLIVVQLERLAGRRFDLANAPGATAGPLPGLAR